MYSFTKDNSWKVSWPLSCGQEAQICLHVVSYCLIGTISPRYLRGWSLEHGTLLTSFLPLMPCGHFPALYFSQISLDLCATWLSRDVVPGSRLGHSVALVLESDLCPCWSPNECPYQSIPAD